MRKAPVHVVSRDEQLHVCRRYVGKAVICMISSLVELQLGDDRRFASTNVKSSECSSGTVFKLRTKPMVPHCLVRETIIMLAEMLVLVLCSFAS
ncbi:unnamed protein product [Toxocara canis]|uniref:Uncharacterized protein n=1 Tax=Toxocara canis TaxID=6265 RepID=A0A183UQX0_TOXCA|nr:unnamed protein product [Toxocara canis]